MNAGNQPNMQPPEDRASDAGRDIKRRGTAQRNETASVNRTKKIIAAIILIMIGISSLGGFGMSVMSNQITKSKKTPETIYKTLGVDSLIDFVEIKGDDISGHYYEFVEDADEKIDDLVENLKRDGNKAITKDLLKKMIKAEVVNQFPFLQGNASRSSSYSGNTVAEKVWNFLIEQGYSEIAVAGLMGNIHQESGGFNPAIVENGGSGEGIGLIQWSFGRRDKLESYAQARGKDWSDVELQLDYLLMELQGGSQYAEDGWNGNRQAQVAWENASTTEEAATIFCDEFERPNEKWKRLDVRKSWAAKYYEQFQGTYDPNASSVQSGSLEGVLLIGDSITEAISSYNLAPEGCIVKAVIGWSPSNWINNFGNLPQDSDSISKICIMLGTNDPSQISQMKQLLNQLHNRYPNKLIYVQKAIPDPNYISQTDNYNREIENYCSTQDYLQFINTLDGIQYEPDRMHPTYEGTKTLIQNIQNSIAGISVKDFLDEAQKVADYVRENNFSYGNALKNPAIDSSEKLVSCDRFVGWVLYNVGFTDQPERQGLTVHPLRDYCIDKGWQEITDVNDLQAGDIVFTKYQGDPYGHTFICASSRSNNDLYKRYDCGSVYRIRSQQPFNEPINEFTKAFRPNFSGLSTEDGEFKGTVRIRRVTPNKNVGEVKNTGTGTAVTTSFTSGGEIEDYINNTATSGDWSVYAKNLTSNSIKVNVNNERLKAASLIKLFIMATAFEEIEKGTLNKSEVINDIRIMINRSDNDATNRLIEKLSFEKIRQYIRTNNYTSTQLSRKMLQSNSNGENYTSVIDVGNLLESMYRGTCVTEQASKEMIEILKTQTLKSKIPAGVPSGVETASKTGELSDTENDAAIVYKNGAHYVVVVMSNNLTDTAKARNDIKEISKKIYNLIDSSSTSQGGTNANAEHRVAIVAGHGVSAHSGSNEEIINRSKLYSEGATGKTSSGDTLKEYQITKKVADYVEKYLAPYSSDVSVVQVGYSQANWERMQLAKEHNVDSYIGIHFDSDNDTGANGINSYYQSGDSKSKSFADIFDDTVSESMGLNNNGVRATSTDNNHIDDIGSSSQWGFPSTIITGGFMSSSSDMKVIGAENEEGLKRYAKGIAAGILEYYGIENRGLDGVSSISSATNTTSGVNSKIYDLKYVSPEKFDEYVESNNRQALNTYTLDSETKKLIVANWSYSTDEGIEIIKSNPINFRAVLNKYTMPIEYMIDFLIHTDDAEMVSKLADLALDTEYIIAIQDNITTVETTVDVHEKNYRITPVSEEIDASGWYTSNFVDWHRTSHDVDVKESVSNKIELTYADSWFVKFSKDSSYASMSFNQASSNNLVADQGELIGNCLITEYCFTCNDDGSGNFGTTATASGRPATEGLSVAVHPSVFRSSGNQLSNGQYIIIEGNVYRVDDCGPTWRPTLWVDMYIPTNGGACVCDRSDYAEVYVANNVRDAATEDSSSEEENVDIEAQNKGLKGVNTTQNVVGKVTETTNVTEETLPSDYVYLGRGAYDVTEKKKITTVRTISNQYDSGKEHVESNEQKFVDVFLSSKGILRRFNMGWMEKMLAKNEKTVNMIDLTKYLYKKAQEQENNIQNSAEQYSFDVYKNNDLYKIYGSSGVLEEFIKSLENNALRLYMSNHVSIDEGEVVDYITFDDDPAYKIITNEYDGRGFGFNIFHRLNESDWNTGKPDENRILEHYEELSVDIKSYTDMNMTLEASTVDQVMRKEIQKWRDIVEDSIKNRGLILEDYQIDALTVIAYEYGWSEKDTKAFFNSYNSYYLTDKKEEFRENFYIAQKTVQPFYIDTSSRDKTEQEEKDNLKRSLIWNLFDTGKYKTPNGEILDPDSFRGGNGEFLEVAYEVWLEVCERFTSYGGSNTPPTGTQIDCSGYVSWVLYEYGVATGNNDIVQEFQGWQHTTETLKTVDWEKLGFEVIPVAGGQDVRSLLQPGDILDRSVGDGASGHTQIIVEVKDGIVYTYDCGGSNHWLGKNGEPYEYTSFAASDSRPGIIIRKR